MALVEKFMVPDFFGQLTSMGYVPVNPPKLIIRPGVVNALPIYRTLDHAAQCMVEGRHPNKQEN